MSIQVPEQYASLIEENAKATGMPENVVAAQVNDESGFNPSAVSPAGAEGMYQFLPSTYDDVAQQAGVQPGTEFDPQDEAKAYDVYMSQLLQEEGGSVEKALEAYNAGPGNLAAGAGYASSILQAANEPVDTTANGGSGTNTGAVADNWEQSAINIFGEVINPAGALEGAAGSAGATAAETAIGDVTNAFWQQFMQIFGISGVKDFAIRAGLIILGFILFIIGVIKFMDIHPVEDAMKVGKAASLL